MAVTSDINHAIAQIDEHSRSIIDAIRADMEFDIRRNWIPERHLMGAASVFDLKVSQWRDRSPSDPISYNDEALLLGAATAAVLAVDIWRKVQSE